MKKKFFRQKEFKNCHFLAFRPMSRTKLLFLIFQNWQFEFFLDWLQEKMLKKKLNRKSIFLFGRVSQTLSLENKIKLTRTLFEELFRFLDLLEALQKAYFDEYLWFFRKGWNFFLTDFWLKKTRRLTWICPFFVKTNIK